MFNSFLVKLRAQNDGEMTNVAKIIHGSLCDVVNQSKYDFYDRNIYKSFVVSGFLKENIYFVNIEKGKYYYFRITTLKKEIFAIFTSFFFRKKIVKDNFTMANISFKVIEIINSPEKSKWAKSFSKKDIDSILKSNLSIDTINLTFIRPTIFKVGSRFYSDINSKLIFINLVNKFIKFSNYEIQDEYINRLFQAKTTANEIKKKKIRFNRFCTEGFLGNIDVNLSNIDEKTKKVAYILLNFAFYSGIGYKTEYGYGQVIIKNSIE